MENLEETMEPEVNNIKSKYNLKIDNFEGPLDLLVFLIDQQKIDITEINISEIANQYMNYLSQMQKMDLEIASSFLVMASDLMYLKSKKLLPQLEDDDQLSEEDLILRILEYKKYKSVQEELKNKYLIYSKRITKNPDKMALKNLTFDRTYNKEELIQAYNFSLEKKEYLFNVRTKDMDVIGEKESVTVFSKIKEIFKELKVSNNFIFSKIFSLEKRSKNDVITAFISILELASKNRVTLKQDIIYGDILVEKKDKEEIG